MWTTKRCEINLQREHWSLVHFSLHNLYLLSGGGYGEKCHTVTQRIGNTVTTYTQCSWENQPKPCSTYSAHIHANQSKTHRVLLFAVITGIFLIYHEIIVVSHLPREVSSQLYSTYVYSVSFIQMATIIDHNINYYDDNQWSLSLTFHTCNSAKSIYNTTRCCAKYNNLYTRNFIVRIFYMYFDIPLILC